MRSIRTLVRYRRVSSLVAGAALAVSAVLNIGVSQPREISFHGSSKKSQPHLKVVAAHGMEPPRVVIRASGSSSGETPIANPPANIPATPNFTNLCWNGALTIQQCDASTLSAINNAHTQDGAKPMVLPSNYYALTPQEKQFVLVNLERVDRGLAPIPYLSNRLDAIAQRAIQGNSFADPWSNSLSAYASNGSGGFSTQLGALYGYMYQDGWGGSAQNTGNVDCTSATASGCWGHRENILETVITGPAAMGSGYSVVSQPFDANSVAGRATISTMIIAQYSPPNSDVIMSWASELPYFSSTAPTGNTTPTGTATPAPYGSVTQALAQPIVGMASTPDGKGYWLVAADGGIFTFGDAAFYGSTGNIHLAQPIVGMASTPDGKGYWLVAADGGIFTFGDAAFYGSTGNIHLAQPIVGMAPTPDGKGYWLVAADGGIFTFGDATFYGSAANNGITATGIIPSADGKGYSIVSSTGEQFAFGDATAGSAAVANQSLVGIASSSSGGFYGVTSSGSVVEG